MRCDEPLAREPREVTPAVGAQQVTIDAPVRVRYTRGYFEPGGPGGDPTELITVQRCPVDGCRLSACREPGEFVPGRVQVLGDNLIFFPDEFWDPQQAYSGVARGVDADLPFNFCSGTLPDTTPPMFGRLDQVTSTVVNEPRCDAPAGGYRISAYFSPAEDPGGPGGSVEYLLFQTRGAGIEEPVLRDTWRNFSATDTISMAFVLPPEQASSVICVRVAAVDGLGNITWSDAVPERDCIDPVQGNYFYPLCAVSAPGRGGACLVGLAALGLVALAWVCRRRRS
jgi:hypothetical protein